MGRALFYSGRGWGNQGFCACAEGAGVTLRLVAVANGSIALEPLNAWLKQQNAFVGIEALAIVSDIPKTDTGKIDRLKAREILDSHRSKALQA